MAVKEFITKFCKKCNTHTIRYKGGVCKPCSDARCLAYRLANREKNRLAALDRKNERIAEAASRTSKNCTKCGVEKPVSEFRIQRRRNNIPMGCCKDCESEYQKSYKNANPEKRKEIVNRSAKKNKDKIYKKNLEYRLANKEAYRVHTRNRRAKQRTTGILSKNISKKLYTLQKGKCACCGLPLGNDYHIDHIMPIALGGTNTDDNIQLLRATCNVQKSAKHPVDYMQQRGFLL